MLGEYGHAISGPGIPKAFQDQIDQMDDATRAEASRAAPVELRSQAAADLMGPEGVRSIGHPNIFPNLWITISGLQMCLRLPRGPGETELWWFTIVPKDMPPEHRRAQVQLATHLFGPAGLLEQDDGENWSQSTRASRGQVSRTLGHTLQMGLGQDEVRVGAGGQAVIDTTVNEHGQRWLYRNWTEWLAADSWGDLAAHVPASPRGKI